MSALFSYLYNVLQVRFGYKTHKRYNVEIVAFSSIGALVAAIMVATTYAFKRRHRKGSKHAILRLTSLESNPLSDKYMFNVSDTNDKHKLICFIRVVVKVRIGTEPYNLLIKCP